MFKLHKLTWIFLPAFIIAGFFFPAAGLAAIICMAAPVVVAFFRGRLWCGNFCPRGSFLDLFIPRLPFNKKAPALFRNRSFKTAVFFIMMGLFAAQIAFFHNTLSDAGSVFVRMISITTGIAVIMGFVFTKRSWCMICPMGFAASVVSKVQHEKAKASECTKCGSCSKTCSSGNSSAS